MFEINRQTKKLYYENPYLQSCSARIVKIGKDYLELDQSIAYPEGGGQESDQGTFTVNGQILRFIHAKKMYGVDIKRDDAPSIKVKGVIWHTIHPEDQPLLTSLQTGQEVTLHIDTERRALLTLNHTACHLLYLAIKQVREQAIEHLLGCHITTASSRFDLTTERFSSEEMETMQDYIQTFLHPDKKIEMFADPEYSDIRYWQCDGQIIPCGGTHLDSTRFIKTIALKRKSPGKGKERILCSATWTNALFESYNL